MVTTETMSVQPIGKGRLTRESDKLPFVCGFAGSVRAGLLKGADATVVQKGDRILAAGDRPDRLCIILSGTTALPFTEASPPATSASIDFATTSSLARSFAISSSRVQGAPACLRASSSSSAQTEGKLAAMNRKARSSELLIRSGSWTRRARGSH